MWAGDNPRSYLHISRALASSVTKETPRRGGGDGRKGTGASAETAVNPFGKKAAVFVFVGRKKEDELFTSQSGSAWCLWFWSSPAPTNGPEGSDRFSRESGDATL